MHATVEPTASTKAENRPDLPAESFLALETFSSESSLEDRKKKAHKVLATRVKSRIQAQIVSTFRLLNKHQPNTQWGDGGGGGNQEMLLDFY